MMMLVYSAMKNRAKGPAAYSTLKPDTSSDSPSVRSKGARFVSARVEINHIMVKGQDGIISHRYSWVVMRVDRVNDPLIRRTESRMMARVISYEIVWATARRAPIKAYLELDAQPDQRIEYTARLDVARINRSPMFKLISGNGIGRGVHMVSAMDRASVGAVIYSNVEEARGRKGSLMYSFTASAKG